jgi:hypothetical protein
MATPNEEVIPDPTLTNQVVENPETGAALDAAFAGLVDAPAADAAPEPKPETDALPEALPDAPAVEEAAPNQSPRSFQKATSPPGRFPAFQSLTRLPLRRTRF